MKLTYMQMLFYVYSGPVENVKIYNHCNLYHIDFVIKDSSYAMTYSGQQCLEIEKKLIKK